MPEAQLHTQDNIDDPGAIHLTPATAAHQEILANLLQLYMHDFSEIIPLELGPDGRFEYPELPLYFSEASRFPFLVAVNSRWAGLVLVRQMENGGSAVWDMAEFFLMRGYRRRGVGTALAHRVFSRFPGAWEVRVMEANRAAVQFWQRAIEGFTSSSLQPERTWHNNKNWDVFRFESPA